MKFSKIVGYFLLIACLNVKGEKLTVASDIWCPYICEDIQAPGYIVELVSEIYQRHDIALKFETIPLARALDLAQQNKIDMVMALTDDHVLTYQLIKNKFSIGSFSNDFFVYGNNPWRFTSVADLTEKLLGGTKLGVIEGYTYGDDINALLESQAQFFHISHGNNPLLNNLKMLEAGRLSIVLDSKNTVFYEAERSKQKNLVYAGSEGKEVFLYMGFARKLALSYPDLLDQGILEYRKSGKLKRLLNKYGIYDWQADTLN
jgi:polar amino acid transport system substrate-binding protein